MGIVDDLLASPGLYVGQDTFVGSGRSGTARIRVTVLPGGAGVSLDYEVLNSSGHGPVLAHAEHTVVGRGDDGAAVMVVAHTHGSGITILRESEPGVFVQGDGPAPYPMQIVLAVPAPGMLRHAWWYGPAGGEVSERDVAEVSLVAS